MPPQRQKKNYKTKRLVRGIDQIKRDLVAPKQLHEHLAIVPSDERPGLGQYYCIPCAKFLETEHAMQTHERGKPHKKRVKVLLGEPYTQAEADAAAGLGTDHGARAGKVLPSDILTKVSRNYIAPEEPAMDVEKTSENDVVEVALNEDDAL